MADSGPGKSLWRRFRHSRSALAGLGLLLLLYSMAALAPHLAVIPYDAMETEDRLQGPSGRYWLGTDHLGRDIWSRVVWGSRISLTVGLVAAGLSVTIGTVVGGLAGYYGGRLDLLISRCIEMVVSMPLFFLLVTLVSVVGRSLWAIMVMIGLTSWPSVARIVRGEFLRLRGRDFVEASRALGSTDRWLIWRQILPNAMAPVIVATTLRVGYAILTESSLSYLGFGSPPPYPTWGSMVASGKDYLREAPWIALAPGFCIFVTVLAFNFVGDGLRDGLDPRSER